MRKLMIVPIAALVVLSACGGSSDPAPQANIVEPATNESVDTNATGNSGEPNALDRVLAMNDRQRNATFIRALLDAELPCEGIEKSERLPDQNGKPAWRVDCRGGNNSHVVSVTPDGTVTINSRNDR